MKARPAPRIGYYIHHQGRGHLHRARALGLALAEAGVRTTFLSSHDHPADLPATAGWVVLARDDEGAVHEPSPGGLLHWVPRRHAGLRDRAARISRWIDDTRPELIISDVSQEVTLLARLHGVPVLSVVLPGDRGDAPHRLGLGVSDRLVGFWPPSATGMVTGLEPDVAARLTPVGALSRFAPEMGSDPDRRTGRRLLVLSGRGGDDWSPAEIDGLRRRSRGWEVTVLGVDTWTDDPWPCLRDADVVVTRAGQASVAEVAAARRPAVVVPARRPHDEQAHTAAQLATGAWPALVRPRLGDVTAADLVDAASLDGSGWASWCDGRAAERFVAVVWALLATTDSGGPGQAPRDPVVTGSGRPAGAAR